MSNAMKNKANVIQLCTDLVKCKSITPLDAGVFDILVDFLTNIGFKTQILEFSSPSGNKVKNLFGIYSFGDLKKAFEQNNVLAFLGHIDVVPPGEGWSCDPFGGVISGDQMIARGIADMKGGVAAFCCAISDYLSDFNNENCNNLNQPNFNAAIEVLLTADEEVGTYEGAQALLNWCDENGYVPTDCFIAEPSSDKLLGDRVFMGHRGSLNVIATSNGKQGHVAYPMNYNNSLLHICRYVSEMSNYNFTHNDKRFPKTNIEPTMLHTGNYATNVVPEVSSCNINIRFGADYTSDSLKDIFLEHAAKYNIATEFIGAGEAYYCDCDKLKNILSEAILETVGVAASFSASGGTSDGRFMIKYCNLIEFGLQDASIHQKNEHANLKDIENLTQIYHSFLTKYFKI